MGLYDTWQYPELIIIGACGCKDTPPAEHDSYKLEVLTGY